MTEIRCAVTAVARMEARAAAEPMCPGLRPSETVIVPSVSGNAIRGLCTPQLPRTRPARVGGSQGRGSAGRARGPDMPRRTEKPRFTLGASARVACPTRAWQIAPSSRASTVHALARRRRRCDRPYCGAATALEGEFKRALNVSKSMPWGWVARLRHQRPDVTAGKTWGWRQSRAKRRAWLSFWRQRAVH